MARQLWQDPYAAQSVALMQDPARARAYAVEKIGEARARSQEIAGQALAAAQQQAGQANANAELQGGQAWAGAVNNIGQTVAAIPGQIQQAQQQSRIAEMQKLQLQGEQRREDAAQRLEEMNRGIGALMSNPEFLHENGTVNGDALYKRISTAMPNGQSGPVQPPDPQLFFRKITEINDDITKGQRIQQQFEEHKANTLARMASTIKEYGKPTEANPAGSYLQLSQLGVAAALKSKQITQQDANSFLVPMVENPESAPQLLDALISRSTAAPIKMGADDSLINPLTLKPIIQGQQKPTEASLAADLSSPDPAVRQRAETAMNRLKPIATPKPPTAGTFEDYVSRYAVEKGRTVESLKPADIEDARKRYNQSDDRPRVDVNVNGQGGTGGLTPDGLELAATAYRLTKSLPARNAGQNAAIISKAAEQAKAIGQTPAAVLQKQAVYQGDTKSLAKMQSMSSAVEAFESKANAQAGLVADLSKKVDRTAYPLVNGMIVSGKAALGDTDAHLLGNALLTFTTEYAKIMEGSTGSAAGSSDAARKDAARLISSALSNNTLQKTVQQMQWEMRQTVLGYDVAISHISERMNPGATAAPQAAPTGGIDVTRGPDGKLIIKR